MCYKCREVGTNPRMNMTWLPFRERILGGTMVVTNREGGYSFVSGKKIDNRNDDEWKKKLTPIQYHILREKGTERAWTGEYNEFKGEGLFLCAGCGNELFDSSTKFDSGSGWPSFYDKINDDAVSEHQDIELGMIRTEVVCSNCGGHLGHVFPDGPEPTGLRYCINSISIMHEDDK